MSATEWAAMDADANARHRQQALGALLERITGEMGPARAMYLSRTGIRDDPTPWLANLTEGLLTTGYHASPTDALQSLVDQLDAQTETEK